MQRVLRKSSPASNNQIPQASLPVRAGALFSCRLSSFWKSAGLQNHRPLVRIHPPSLREGYYKTETPVPGSDTGVLGGRGWIRTSSTITIRWMRFEIVMDSCAFFEFHQKSIIGYHNHLGTKTGYKVGYFARGEYSARASETAIAAVSALPSTA